MDEDSLDQAPSPPLSALSPSLIKPLNCQTSTAALLRNYRHNPMIGGPGVLPSPPFGPTSSSDSSSSCEVSPPGLTPVDTESTSDSGIDDINMMEASSPIRVQLEQPRSPHFKPLTSGCSAATKDMLLMKCLNSKAAKKRALLSESQLKQQKQTLPTAGGGDTGNGIANLGESKTNNHAGGRKGSLTSFIDNINPLMEPFIMDLCNDDYDVATEPLMGQTEIDHVLNNWRHDMA